MVEARLGGSFYALGRLVSGYRLLKGAMPLLSRGVGVKKNKKKKT